MAFCLSALLSSLFFGVSLIERVPKKVSHGVFMIFRSRIAKISFIMPALIFSCGKKADDSTDAVPVTDTTALTTSTEVPTAAAGSAQTTVTTALTAGDSGSNGSAAALTVGFPLDGSITKTRACTADATAKSATVTLTFSGTENFVSPTKVTVSEIASGTQTRVWTNSNNAVACTANAQYPLIAWKSGVAVGAVSGVNGLQVVDTAARSQTITSSFTNKAGVLKTRTVVTATTGTHTINFSGFAATVTGPVNTAFSTTKNIVSNVTKKEKLTKFDGTTVLLDATHGTPATLPLVVTTTRTSLGVPLSHTIASGQVTMTNTGAFYITNDFSGVVYDLTSNNPCVPTAGKMVQNIYKSNSAADTATALKTLTYTYNANTVAVTSSAATDDAAALTEHATANMNHKCDLKGGE